MGIKYGEKSVIVDDSLSQSESSKLFLGKGGPGKNRIEIIDINEKFSESNRNKKEKSGCCASC
jgi:hypothetical protein|tara:strand:+ start:388 stop:576 length:189 start_codon:yes stop_codon:yes gene_type:complete